MASHRQRHAARPRLRDRRPEKRDRIAHQHDPLAVASRPVLAGRSAAVTDLALQSGTRSSAPDVGSSSHRQRPAARPRLRTKRPEKRDRTTRQRNPLVVASRPVLESRPAVTDPAHHSSPRSSAPDVGSSSGGQRRDSSPTSGPALLDPDMVHDWLRLPFPDWCASVRTGSLLIPTDLNTDAFAAKVARCSETCPDMSVHEQRLPDGPFRHAVEQELQQRGHPPIVRSIFNKVAALQRLQDDPDSVNAARQYVSISRGWVAAPAGLALDRLAYKGNYVDPDTDDPRLVAAVDKELARSESEGFCAEWKEVAVEDGCPHLEQPALLHPVGAYLKQTIQPDGTTLEKARIFVDPGPSGLNAVDGGDDYTTALASVADARAAVSRGVPYARGDFKDAFLGHAVAHGQARYQGVRWRGRTLAFRKMILGHRRSPRQMQASIIAIIRSFHRELRERGCPVQDDPPFHSRPPRHRPQRSPHGGVTATPGYVDDEACFTTSTLAAWYTFAVWLHVCTDEKVGWNLPLSFGAGKTCPPRLQQVFLGFTICAATMTIAVPVDKLGKLLAKIDSFLRLEDADGEHNTVHSALSVAGSLQHVFDILPFGKAFYRSLLSTALAAGRHCRHKRIQCSRETLEDVQFARLLLTSVSETNVITGLRRPRMFGAVYTDASLTGWCYHCAALGILETGEWPSHWLDRIATHSQFEAIWISELEAIVVLFAARRVLPYMRLHRCHFFVDNKGVVNVLNKLSTCSRRIRPVITEIAFLSGAFDAEIIAQWISSERNTLADCGSRPEVPVTTTCPACGSTFRSQWAQQRHWFHQHLARPSTPPTLCEPARPELLPSPVGMTAYGVALSDVDQSEMRRLLPLYATANGEDTVAPPAFVMR